MVPSKTKELLLELSWHKQNWPKHGRLTNTYSFLSKSHQIVLVPKENDHDQILKRDGEKIIIVESLVNEKNKVIEKREVERKEIHEEVKKKKKFKRKKEDREKKLEKVEKKYIFERKEDKIEKKYFFENMKKKNSKRKKRKNKRS